MPIGGKKFEFIRNSAAIDRHQQLTGALLPDSGLKPKVCFCRRSVTAQIADIQAGYTLVLNQFNPRLKRSGNIQNLNAKIDAA